MPAFQLIIMDVDVSAYAIDLGTLEELQTTLFTNSQLISGQHSIVLDNTRRTFTPGAAGALFNSPWYNAHAQLFRDGALAFEGLIQGLRLDTDGGKATIDLVNVLSPLADRIVDLTGAGLNPAEAALALLEQVGMDYYLDRNSFGAAGLAAGRAGAVVSITMPSSARITAMQALQQICDTCSLDVEIVGPVIYFRTFKAYKGNGQDLRAEVNYGNVRAVEGHVYDRRSMANQCVTSWGTSQTLVVTRTQKQAAQSQKGDPNVIETTLSAVSGAQVGFEDVASASYFTNLLLDRTANMLRQVTLTLDPAFSTIAVGDRHPINLPADGLVRAPMQAIIVRKTWDDDAAQVTFISLSGSQQ